jgi:hypothetical protein
MAAPAPAAIRKRKRVPWPAHSRQRFLCCLVCASDELCARGLCRSCYDAAYRDESYFSGCKERVLIRDQRRCRVCGLTAPVVHHRRPGVDRDEWLITLCPACHATVERLQQLDRYLPPLLLELWREQHPQASDAQLQFELGGTAG